MNVTRKTETPAPYESPQMNVFFVQAEKTTLTLTSRTVDAPEGYDGLDEDEFEW